MTPDEMWAASKQSHHAWWDAAHAPRDLADLLAVAEAARDVAHGAVPTDESLCPHCGGDSCYEFGIPMRCTATGRAVWLDQAEADRRLPTALARLDGDT